MTGAIHVCPLSRLDETLQISGAQTLVTLMKADSGFERPSGIKPHRHLWLTMSDISAPLDGHLTPAEEHIRMLIDFVRVWDRSAPLVIHCYAGVSRSAAAAFAIMCALAPDRSESQLAQSMRELSPTATPNPLIVSLADAYLARQGRMVEAVLSIGRGVDCFEGVPFRFDLD